MRKRKCFVSLLIATLTVFVLSLCAGIIFSLSPVTANAVDYELEGYELEDYVVAQNDDFGGAATLSWNWGSDATSNLKLTNTTETASFVYKFNFTPNGGGQTALALRSSYWGSYYFIFQEKTLWYHLNSTSVKVGEVFTDGAQLVEVGAIDVKDSNLTWFFLKVNGEIKMSETASDVPDKKAISVWGPQAVFAQYSYNVTFTDVETKEVLVGEQIGSLPTAPKKVGYDFVKWTCGGEEVTAETVVSADMTVVAEYAERGYYIDEELEDYVVAQNDDFGGATTLSWPDGGATSGLTLNNDLPTASFIYKFNFTPNSGGQTALALRSSYYGDYHFVFQGKKLLYNLNTGVDYVTVGEVFTDGAQLVEVGAIEIKDSDLTWFFLKVNGEIKMSTTAANVPDVKSISAWGDETAKIAQYSYDVSFTGVETREVLAGEQIGSLPTAP